MKNCLIYSITNLVNGKIYVGQTRQGLPRRKGEHIYRFNLGERDHKLYQAMRKYGIENFRFDVLCCCLKPEYLDEMEVHFIAQFNSFKRGYNMTCGGDSVSDETRKKIGVAHKGRVITWHSKLWESRRANPDFRPAREYVASGAANTSAKSYLIRFPNGEERVVTGLNQFCKEHGLTKKCLFDILEGKQKHHKGFSLLARFNDYGDSRYSQVAGNGAQPAPLAG